MSLHSHRLGRIDLAIEVPDIDMALQLRARVEDWARGEMAAVMERVFDALAPLDRIVSIDRLALDLGSVTAESFEPEALAALERRLPEALSLAMAEAEQRSPAEHRLHHFESYLRRGTLAFTGEAAAFEPAAQLRRMAVEQLADLVALVRRCGRDRVALQRLALQAGEGGLVSLLGLLAPADAAAILAYLDDLSLLHRAEPPVPLAEPALRRLIWLLTLEYLLRDAGSQFNRRSFVEYLLLGVAEDSGIEYAVLLDLLRAGLDRLEARRPLGSSLPAVLRLLFDDLPPEPAPNLPAADGPELDALLAAIASDDRARLLPLLRRAAPDRPVMTALARRLSEPAFTRLLHAVEPVHAPLILAYMADLVQLHRDEAILALSETGFIRLLRLVILLHAVREAGSQFNRRTWLRDLLRDLAASAGIAYARLLSVLAGAIEKLRRHLPPSSSLPALIGELVTEQAPAALSDEDPPEAIALVERFLRTGQPALGGLRLRHGLEGLLRRLAVSEPSELPRRIERLLIWLPPEEIALCLSPADPVAILRWVDHLTAAPGGTVLRAWQQVLATMFGDDARPPQTTPSRAAPGDESALLAWLSGSGPDQPEAIARLIPLLADLAETGDPKLDAILRRGLTQESVRARWVAALPPEILARLVYRIAPARARIMLEAQRVLELAWRETAPHRAPGLWARLLTQLAAPNPPGLPGLVRVLVRELTGGTAAEAAPLLARAAHLARDAGQAALAAAFDPPQRPKPKPDPARRAGNPDEASDHGAPLYVRNAGLVLINPFLPQFMERLGLLSLDDSGVPRIDGIEPASRAVHLLQYLVDAHCDRPEPDLVLNKLLCGLPPSTPVLARIEPAPDDLTLCDQLIRSIIANWPVIRSTSPAGLRETFFQREGKLQRAPDKWLLRVQRKTVDVLTDQIPWSFAVIYHRWMKDPIHVTW